MMFTNLHPKGKSVPAGVVAHFTSISSFREEDIMQGTIRKIRKRKEKRQEAHRLLPVPDQASAAASRITLGSWG